MTKTTEEEVLTHFKLPLKYDDFGQKIWDQDNKLVADVRSWGHFQKFENGEELQDKLGEMIVEAFNQKYHV